MLLHVDEIKTYGIDEESTKVLVRLDIGDGSFMQWCVPLEEDVDAKSSELLRIFIAFADLRDAELDEAHPEPPELSVSIGPNSLTRVEPPDNITAATWEEEIKKAWRNDEMVEMKSLALRGLAAKQVGLDRLDKIIASLRADLSRYQTG